jgi:hypothetical protein
MLPSFPSGEVGTQCTGLDNFIKPLLVVRRAEEDVVEYSGLLGPAVLRYDGESMLVRGAIQPARDAVHFCREEGRL